MREEFNYKKFSVLYVDDEEQALKYFTMSLKDNFRIITASSADMAWEIIEKKGMEIGVLITDQRMPGKSGVDLLKKLRETYPMIVRVITTAYTEMESTIDSINMGAVFHYIQKPWDIPSLQLNLCRAMEYYILQVERDFLLNERIYVLQRLIVSDRVRSLAVMAAGLAHRFRNSMTGLQMFMDLMPTKLNEELEKTQDIKDPTYWKNNWSLAQKECKKIINLVQEVIEATFEFSDKLEDEVTLQELLHANLDEFKEMAGMNGVKLSLHVDGESPKINCNKLMLEKMLTVLVKSIVGFSKRDNKVRISAIHSEKIWGANGIKITISSDGPEWQSEQVHAMFTMFSKKLDEPTQIGTNLLFAFLIVHHHSGDIVVHRKHPRGPCFDILLPLKPSAVIRPGLENHSFEKVLAHMEKWEKFMQS